MFDDNEHYTDEDVALLKSLEQDDLPEKATASDADAMLYAQLMNTYNTDYARAKSLYPDTDRLYEVKQALLLGIITLLFIFLVATAIEEVLLWVQHFLY